MTPHRLHAGDSDLAALLDLIRAVFGEHDGRIDPPSSMHRLVLGDLENPDVEVWAMGTPPCACVVLTPKDNVLYLGKLAVAPPHRGAGMARALVAHATQRAIELGLTALELQTRVELVENHRLFDRLGFVQTGQTAHPGFQRATSITMQKPVSPG